MSRWWKTVAVAAALSAPLAACDDDGGPRDARLTLLLTDAPGDIVEAQVVITRIVLAGRSDAGGDGQTVVFDGSVTADLTELENEVLTLVDDVAVPPGTYGQLRVIVPEACIEVENDGGGTSVFASPGFAACGTPDGELQMPSFAQTGIKVILPGGGLTLDDEQEILLLDFDVSQSFGRAAGQSDRWVMHPVIKATEVELTGSIEVTLQLDEGVTLPGGSTLADFSARLEDADGNDEGQVSFADTDGDGTFTARFGFLVPGEGPYQVEVIGPADVTFTTNPATPQTVTVLSGQTTTVVFTIESASAT